MTSIAHMSSVLDALPDPAFLFTKKGKYIAVFGGKDTRYYHDGSGLVGLYIADLIKPEKANWFLKKIDEALQSKKLLIEEYELSNRDVQGLPDEGPEEPIWFEGRIQALDILVNNEEVVLWVASNVSARHELELKLHDLSNTDQLTRLFNRRKLIQELTNHYDLFVRHSVLTSILILDLDGLKPINDSHGHAKGDEVIATAADVCRSVLRKTDIACRFGGDEFVIALPNTDQTHAEQFSERLRARFNRELKPFCVDGIVVTASIGVTTFLPTDLSYEVALERADSAMYQAKRNGGNQIVSA